MSWRANCRLRALVLCLWLALLSGCLPAAAQVLNEVEQGLTTGLASYDYRSIVWGVLVAAVGGFGRTVLTLLSPSVIVLDALKETWRDLLIAALAGAVADVILQAVQSVGVHIPIPLQVLILSACGWARMGTFAFFERSGHTLADRATRWAADKISAPTWSEQRDELRVPEPTSHRVDNPEDQP
jgi:hypothetical protein